MSEVRSARGMRDVLPVDARRWQFVERILRDVLYGFAYDEVRFPIIEQTTLFKRSVGEATDIVEKEMYSFQENDGDSLTLRPEGTAGCARMLLQQGLLFNQTQRVFYAGPMFRRERPQKGRYREFYQIGAEAFGLQGPDIDAELLLLGFEFWRRLGIADLVRLEINTLGTAVNRQAYGAALLDYLRPRADALDEDSRRRLDKNPLRILDSKNPGTQAVLANAPTLRDFVDEQSQAHFTGLLEMLAQHQVPYTVNDRLVRGLDYYTHTVFEWVTDALGAQGAVCAGGRYDGLVEQLGGKPMPGAGFALGIDRVLLLHEIVDARFAAPVADVYICVMQDDQVAWAQRLAGRLRQANAQLRVRCHAGGGKLKRQLSKADQSGARWAFIIGEAEVAQGKVTVKYLREKVEQKTISVELAIAETTQTLTQ